MAKILVIGSEGNVGKLLVKYLEAIGHYVITADIKPMIRERYYQADINVSLDYLKIFDYQRPEIVYLLAAQVSRILCEDNGNLAVNTNISGTYNIIELCRHYNARLIFMSTSEIYGNQECVMDERLTIPQPNNRYGLTKYIAEQLIKYECLNQNGINPLKAIILRPFMLYHESETRGAHRSAIIRFVESLMNKQKIIIHKNSGRCWFYMEDAIKAMANAATIKPTSNLEVFNIGSNELTGTEYLAKIIGDKLGLNYLDYAIFEDLPEGMTLRKVPNIDRMVNIVGVKPTISLDEGLDRVIASFGG